MLMKFWEGLGSGLADKFLARLFTPALLFWTTGAMAWLYSSLGLQGARLSVTLLGQAASAVVGLSGTLQLAALIGAAFLLIASALAAEQATLPLLRVIEGYYWPRRLAGRVSDRHRRRRARMRDRWKALVGQAAHGELVPELAMELAELEEGLRRVPESSQLVMPTRLGNILRAAEERPSVKYGLDVAVTWPMLWLLLDKDTREEVANARSALNGSVTLLLWALLSLVWTPLAWWVAPIAVAVALAVYYVPILSSAQVYGDLMGSVFDLRRTCLYDALRWPLPATPAGEQGDGRALTMYLWRGIAPAGARFCPEPPPLQVIEAVGSSAGAGGPDDQVGGQDHLAGHPVA
jgi:hypothetical protein